MNSRADAFVGVSDHAGWAVFVTVTPDGILLDRRRVELVAADLPRLPHHHEAQALPPEQGLKLIERVRLSAERHAHLALDAVIAAVSVPIRAIAIRACPPLPSTTAERIRNYRAQNVADTVMYRQELASAAAARRWSVHWYDAKTVLRSASGALHLESLDSHFVRVQQSVGPPWNKDHRLAMAAAIVAASESASH